ncbi:MAG: hypothetical protein FWG43_02745, partial [Clostridiales bacterium]|nr:hypothetical protein [Clostridiales bacterium]
YCLTDCREGGVGGGTGPPARLQDWPTAGKTGTVELPSEDKDYDGKRGHKDIWFSGYTPELCGAVWMGYDNKFDAERNLQYLPRVYGGGPTAKLWKVVMTACHEGLEVKQFAKPAGLVGVTIDTKSGTKPSSLTPSNFIGSEIYDSRYVPTEVSDIWKVVEICADSERKAGEYCPNKTTTVKMVIDDLSEGQERSTRVADYGWYAPQSYCSIHTTPQGDLTAVYICTDPRHGAERVLANLPSAGYSGGCPQETVALRNYGAAYLPTATCQLAEHALEHSAAPAIEYPVGFGDNPNNPGVSGSNTNPTNPNSSGYPTSENGAPILQTPHSLAIHASGRGCLLSWAAHNDPATTTYIVKKIVDNDAASDVRYQISGYSFDDSDVQTGHVYTYSIYAYNATYSVISGWSQSVSFSL